MECSLTKSEKKEDEGSFYKRKWVMHQTAGIPAGAVLTPIIAPKCPVNYAEPIFGPMFPKAVEQE